MSVPLFVLVRLSLWLPLLESTSAPLSVRTPAPDQVKVAADAKEDALRIAALMMVLRLQRRAEPVCFSRRETNDFSHSINRIECLKRLDALTKHPRHSMNAAHSAFMSF